MNIKELFMALDDCVPESMATDWDKSGPQIVFPEQEVTRILTTLEVLPRVVEEAISKDCQVILSHHPLFFTRFGCLDMGKPKDIMILNVLDHRISVYSAHTNYDIASGGTTDYLAKQLSLLKVHEIPGSDGFAKAGILPRKMRLDEFVEYTCEATDTPVSDVRFVGNSDSPVLKVGICAGAGSEFAFAAVKDRCDVFLTGDLKYHLAQDCVLTGINLVDIGHYHSEKHFSTEAAVLYGKYIENVEFIPSEIDIDPFSVL